MKNANFKLNRLVSITNLMHNMTSWRWA